MAKKKEKWPQHKSGKYWEYDLYEDGSIQVAPAYYNSFDGAMDQRAGIGELIKFIIEKLNELYQPTSTIEHRFWEQIQEDYDLDYINYSWTYDRDTHKITPTLKQKNSINGE